MMKRPKTKLPELLTALNFPRNGEIVGGVQVIKAKATMDDDILKYEVHFPKGTKAKQIPTLLRQFYSTQVIPGKAGLVVRHHDYSVGPKEGNVAVVGAMHIIPVVRANPGIQEFDQEYSKMEMKNPETFFRVFPYKGFNSPQFRAKLFSFVGFIGENYGYCDGKNIYHRRASLVMPKIKITKAIPHAKMMYHTHPSKDEPSLSSPDDYLLYMDLSHAPRSIRHFMTVMKDRMDHFQITPKKGSKANFLKLQEDKILEEIDAKIGELEKKWDAKTPVKDGVPKKEQHAANLEFCENITRDLVKWMNTKYGKFFSFKYNCYYRVRKNPDGPTADNLHLDDEFLQKAIGDINSRRYSWPEFRTSDMPHESYAYWHQQYYKHHVKDSAMTLGVTPQGGDKRVYERFMSQSFEGSTLSNQDALNVLNVAYDIAKHDSKIRDGGELQSRMDDLASYLQLTDEARETLVMLEHVLHNEDVFSETAQTMAGDYYPLILLSKYSISAIEAIDQVKAGKLDLEMAKVKVYVNLKRRTSDALLGFLYRNNERGNFVDSYLNPPSIRFQRVDMASQIPPEALEYYDIAAEALGEFSAARYDSKSPFFTARNKFNLRVPTKNGMVTVMIPQRTGTVELKTSSAEPMEAAMEAMDKIGAALYRAGLPVDPEEFNVTTLDAAVNPAPQVIAICGPSGSGKSTTIRNLLRELPNSKTVPTYTTRQKRASDKEGERVFVTEEQFKRHLRAGDMVTAKLQKNGNYYGRMLSDFSNADYVIVDVTLSGLNELRRAFPNTFSVYLEPVEDPKYIQKRLLRRGDMSPQEARKRAEIIPSHIESSKAMNFDVRVQTKQGQFDYAAREVLSALPRSNPLKKNHPVFCADCNRVARKANEELAGVVEVEMGNRWDENKDFIRKWWPPTKRALGTIYPDIKFKEVMKASNDTPKVRLLVSPNYFEEGHVGWAVSDGSVEKLVSLRGGLSSLKRGAFDQYKDDPTFLLMCSIHEFTAHNLSYKEPLPDHYTGVGKHCGKRSSECMNGHVDDFTEQQREYITKISEFNPNKKSLFTPAKPKKKLGKTLDDFGFEEVTADATKGDLTKIGKRRAKPTMLEDQVPQSGELTPGQMTLIEAIRAVTGEEEVKENPVRRADPVDLERFTKWVKLVNMKNKELKEFLDSDLGKKAGLNKKRQKEFGGINRGRTSGLAILRMRGKLGLTGPKDYIKNGPRIIEGYYNMALEKWNETDWYWCGRQISFNSRARGQRGPYTDNKGRPTRKLLALWVWGHDPWRYARKIEGKERMPPCPNVPWVGMTEKRKYGTTEFVYKNPAFVVGKPTEHSFQLRIEPDDADPIKLEALRAATDKSFKHHKWYVIHHLDYVMKIAHALKPRAQPDEKEIINDIVWMHDYPKMMGDKDNYELVRELVAKHKGKDYADELVGYLEDMEMIKAVDSMYGVETTIFALIMSTADALAHYYGPFFQIFHDENPDLTIAELKKKNQEKLEKDKRKLRAGPMEGALDGIKFRYKGRKIKVTGNEHIAELIERSNPRRTPGGKAIPKRYLKGLTKEEMQIAIKEIDKGYKYDIDDPEAYEYWKSDIKATARGYKPVPSKYKKKFIKMYGPLPETGDFLTKMSKATGIKKSILQKVYDKGLAAWRTGHRPGVQQHQWAAGRVYSFVTLGNTVMKGKKKMGDYSLAVEAGLIKENPPKISHYPDPDPESPKGMQRIDLHEEEKNIGYLLWYREGGKTWIHYINVSKDHRGKRLGRLLISELLAKTKGEEIHLHAPIGAPREHLVQWYESMGFNLLEGDTNEMVLQNPSTADFFPGDADVAHPYMTAQTIPITALQNGGEWRHGEFAEDDPFDEYF